MFKSKTSIAGLITIIASVLTAWLTGDVSGLTTSLAAGVGLLAAKDDQ